MKALLGIVSLLLVLGVTSLLVKKQLAPVSAQGAQTPTAQSAQQLPQQVKQQVQAAVQQQPVVPDDK